MHWRRLGKTPVACAYARYEAVIKFKMVSILWRAKGPIGALNGENVFLNG